MPRTQKRSRPDMRDSLTIVSYNVENLFDTIDNHGTDDEDFTPEGAKHWTKRRYHKKLHHLAKTLAYVGGGRWPSLVCLVEVENARVIKDLLYYTGMRERGYKFVITHSLDPRGIDVAILYRQEEVELLSQREYDVVFASDRERKSRNVLELAFALPNGDTLYAMGVHWPSRREGVRETEALRCDVAREMRRRCDSIYQSLSEGDRSRTHFVLMGDFNEEASEPAIRKVLRASLELPTSHSDTSTLALYSLMNPYIEAHIKRHQAPASYCYQGVWTQLDHFIVSESLLKTTSRTYYQAGSARNYYKSFLGSKHTAAGFPIPYRTYGGNEYLGGYSDHYPIRMTLMFRQE